MQCLQKKSNFRPRVGMCCLRTVSTTPQLNFDDRIIFFLLLHKLRNLQFSTVSAKKYNFRPEVGACCLRTVSTDSWLCLLLLLLRSWSWDVGSGAHALHQPTKSPKSTLPLSSAETLHSVTTQSSDRAVWKRITASSCDFRKLDGKWICLSRQKHFSRQNMWSCWLEYF